MASEGFSQVRIPLSIDANVDDVADTDWRYTTSIYDVNINCEDIYFIVRFVTGNVSEDAIGKNVFLRYNKKGIFTEYKQILNYDETPLTGGEIADGDSISLNVFDSNYKLPRRSPMWTGANVASENNLLLGSDGNVFHITGTTQINLIASTNWQSGSPIVLIFDDVVTVKHNTAVSGVNKPILLSGNVDFVSAANTVIQLIYDGTSWYEIPKRT